MTTCWLAIALGIGLVAIIIWSALIVGARADEQSEQMRHQDHEQ